MARVLSHAAPITQDLRRASAVFEQLAHVLRGIEVGQNSTGAVLDHLVQLLRQTTSCLQAAAFDLRRTGDARFEIRQVVSSPGSEPSPQFLSEILSDPAFLTGSFGLVDYRRRSAFQSPAGVKGTDGASDSHALVLRLCDESGLLAGAILSFHDQPEPEDRTSAESLSLLGAALLGVAREQRFAKGRNKDADQLHVRMFEALRLSADGYWEADGNEVVKHVVMLSENEQTSRVLGNLQGKSLAALLNVPQRALRDGAGSLGAMFHEQRALIQEIGQQEFTLDLSGRRSHNDGTWSGIARLVNTPREFKIADRQVRSVIEKLEAARDREESHRRETEVILDGLRILTSPTSNAQVFSSLLAHLAPAMEFQDAVILQKEWSGRITVCAATSSALEALDWQSEGRVYFEIEEVAVICNPPGYVTRSPQTVTPGLMWHSALVTRIKGGTRPAILLCLHSSENFFSTRHLGLGTRLSLVASQAFMNEEERQKVVQASKLATVGEMAAGIVHEINQPLSAMTLAIENFRAMIDSEIVDHDKVHVKLDRFKTQIGRIAKIVASMRTLARHSEGIAEPFAVRTAIADAATIIRHKLTKSAIELTIEISDDIVIHGNPLEFTQVILNLLSNACDAIDSREPAPRIDDTNRRFISVIADESAGEWIFLYVRDTGPGFPKIAIEKALEPFFTTKGLGEGTGLGLAISQRIIEEMGGEIALGNWAEGAEIRLRLPKNGRLREPDQLTPT